MISVWDMMLEGDLDAIFQLPLSTQAHEEMMNLQNYLVTLEYDDSFKDSWSLIWGANYSS